MGKALATNDTRIASESGKCDAVAIRLNLFLVENLYHRKEFEFSLLAGARQRLRRTFKLHEKVGKLHYFFVGNNPAGI